MNSTPHFTERPFAAVLLSIFEDIQELVRSEARLAKAEVRAELAGIAQGAGWLVAGIAGAFFAICFMLLAAFFCAQFHGAALGSRSNPRRCACDSQWRFIFRSGVESKESTA